MEGERIGRVSVGKSDLRGGGEREADEKSQSREKKEHKGQKMQLTEIER